MEIIEIKISELKPAEYNPRALNEKEKNDLVESIKRFGMVEPIVVNEAPDRKNIIIGGHQRYYICKELGRETIPVVFVDIPDIKKEQELNLRLNRNLGHWDWDLLANFDKEELLDAGFMSEEIEKNLGLNAEDDGFDAKKEYDAIGEAQTMKGDLYIMGGHRLLCGDSTVREDVERLMDEQKAQMIFTDPPYNVNYNYAKYEAINKSRKKKFLNSGKIFNDNKTEEQFYQFLLDTFGLAYEHSVPEMAIYVCFATKSEPAFRMAFEDAGFLFSQTIIWLKERIILSLGQDYHRIYEPILFGWKKGEKHYSNRLITTASEFWTLDRESFDEQMDLWMIERDKSIDYDHPTQKPVKLPERAIKKNSRPGDILYEPFSGSGSATIACEQLERRCFSMELDPRYCDVIVKRWEKATGKKAEVIRINTEKNG